MKETIREDEERKQIGVLYLNDNTKIEYTLEDKQVLIAVRYVAGFPKSIKEDKLTAISYDEYINNMDENIKFSEDNKTIAVFRKIKEGYQLEKVYDIEQHCTVHPEFMDIVYEEKFPNTPLNTQLVLVNKN